MSNCIDIRPVPGCFIPNNEAIAAVPIMIHYIYADDETPKGVGISSVDDPETLLDPTSYLGGGTYKAGSCDDCTPQCWEICTVDIFVDNQSNGEPPWGPMLWPYKNWEITLNMSDGSTVTIYNPATNVQGDPLTWRQNIEQAAAAFADATGKPWERRSAPLDGDPATPVANHMGVTCCCGDPVPVSAFGRVMTDSTTPELDKEGNEQIQPILTGSWNKKIEKVWLCRDCYGNEKWTNDAGDIIEKPTECLYPCGLAPAIPSNEEGDCTVEIIPACEFDVDNNVVTQGIFLNYVICGTTVRLESAVTFPNGPGEDPVEHILGTGNVYKNCDSTDIVTPTPEDDCPCPLPTVECGSPCCESAVRLTQGRPATGLWEYAGYSGNTITELENAYTAATGGQAYITNQNGTGDGTGSNEAHWMCPATDGAVVTFNGEPIRDQLVLSPNPYTGISDCDNNKALFTSICKADLDYLIAGIVSGIVGEPGAPCPCEDDDVIVEPEGLCDTNGDGTGKPSCTETMTCTVFKDFGHKAGDTSQFTIDNVKITGLQSICPTAFADGTITGIDVGNGSEDIADDVNTNLESWINTNLGAFGFSAVPATVTIPNTGGSVGVAFMDLTFPTCEAWILEVSNVPTSYNGANAAFDTIRYEYDGQGLFKVVLLKNGVEVTPTFPNAGNLPEGVPINSCEADVTIGDQTICASVKIGSTFFSSAPGSGTQQGQIFLGSGNVLANTNITYKVTDSAGTVHNFVQGQTVTGMASGPVQQVAASGTLHWSDGINEYQCPITDKLTSANFTVL